MLRGAPRLCDLSNFRALQVSNFQTNLAERGKEARQHRADLREAVGSLVHAYGRDGQSQPLPSELYETPRRFLIRNVTKRRLDASRTKKHHPKKSFRSLREP